MAQRRVGFSFPQLPKRRWDTDCLRRSVSKLSLFSFPITAPAARQSSGKCFPVRMYSALNCLNYVSVYCLSGGSSS